MSRSLINWISISPFWGCDQIVFSSNIHQPFFFQIQKPKDNMCNSWNLRCWTTCFNFNFTVQESGSFSTIHINLKETKEWQHSWDNWGQGWFSSLFFLITHSQLSSRLCEQDISACTWRWGSGPSSWSEWHEPGPHQGPWCRLLWKSLWIQRQNELSFFLQPHHVWDWGGVLAHRKTRHIPVYKPSQPSMFLLASPLLPVCFRWWFQPTQRRCVSFRSSVSLSVSVLWTSACH